MVRKPSDPQTCGTTLPGRLSCSRCLWRGLLIGAFVLFLVTVLTLLGGDAGAPGAIDQPISPGLFALLALGFMVFAVAGPAFLDRLSGQD